MSRTVQKTLTGEAAKRQTVATQPPVNLTDMIWLPIKYLVSTANLQRLLFLLAFLTYGVGDGVTAAYMMDRKDWRYTRNKPGYAVLVCLIRRTGCYRYKNMVYFPDIIPGVDYFQKDKYVLDNQRFPVCALCWRHHGNEGEPYGCLRNDAALGKLCYNGFPVPDGAFCDDRRHDG